jgi:hypothetical protein
MAHANTPEKASSSNYGLRFLGRYFMLSKTEPQKRQLTSSVLTAFDRMFNDLDLSLANILREATLVDVKQDAGDKGEIRIEIVPLKWHAATRSVWLNSFIPIKDDVIRAPWGFGVVLPEFCRVILPGLSRSRLRQIKIHLTGLRCVVLAVGKQVMTLGTYASDDAC